MPASLSRFVASVSIALVTFGTSAQMWINLQARYDLEMARQQVGDRVAAEVVPFGAARPTPGPCP